MKSRFQRLPQAAFIVVALLFIYAIVFLVGYPALGSNMGMLAFLPAVGAAWLVGTGAGVSMWLLMIPTMPILLALVGDSDPRVWTETIWWLGMFVALVITLITGHTRNLSSSLRRELAEHKKTEAALKRSEQFVRSITESSLDIVYVFDLEALHFVYTSRSLPQLLGYTDLDDQTPRGQNTFLRSAMHPDDYPNMIKKLQQYAEIRDGEVLGGEYRVRHANGEWRWFYNREIVFARNPDGTVRQMLGTSHDITERKRAADVMIEKEKLQVALQKEKELAQLKNRFMNIVTHEFRTPLAIIQSSGELLDHYFDKMSQERRREAVSTINAQIQYVSDMLKDMTLVAAGEDHLEVKPVLTDVAAFCKRLGDQIAQAKSHPVIFSCDGDLESVPVDSKLLHHILNNLLSNAVKYSPDGAPVHLNVRKENGELIFSIRDRGIGIPTDDQDHIFDTFYRAKNVGNIGGTGLGLRIVRDYVALLGGSISVESLDGKGTTFTVRLPVMETEAIALVGQRSA